MRMLMTAGTRQTSSTIYVPSYYAYIVARGYVHILRRCVADASDGRGAVRTRRARLRRDRMAFRVEEDMSCQKANCMTPPTSQSVTHHPGSGTQQSSSAINVIEWHLEWKRTSLATKKKCQLHNKQQFSFENSLRDRDTPPSSPKPTSGPCLKVSRMTVTVLAREGPLPQRYFPPALLAYFRTTRLCGVAQIGGRMCEASVSTGSKVTQSQYFYSSIPKRPPPARLLKTKKGLLFLVSSCSQQTAAFPPPQFLPIWRAVWQRSTEIQHVSEL